MSFSSNPERAIIASNLSSRAAAGSPLTRSRRMPDLAGDRIESSRSRRGAASIDSALPSHAARRRSCSAERGQNARLADARFARDQRDLTFTPARLAPAASRSNATSCSRPTKGVQVPCDRDASNRLRFSASRRTAQPQNRRVEALESLRAKRRQLESPAQQPSCRLRDHDACPARPDPCNRAARLGVYADDRACSCAEPLSD